MHLQAGQLATAASVREARVGDFPTVSVLVVSTAERESLEACLTSLLPQCEDIGAQLLVIRAGDASELEQVHEVFPSVGFYRVESGTPLSEMRALAVREAEGDIILLETDRAVPENWLVPRIAMRPRGGAGLE